ncbi:MAG: wax ester/triacylglycerol synthase family O-acyltransferase [Acidimicrobiia bacterium]
MERMNNTEAIMWAVEADPAFRSDFANLVILEGAPDEARIRTKVAQALAAIPRMRERAIADPLDLAPPLWAPDPEFDINYHLRKIAVPAPGDERALLDLVGSIIATPLDRSRPLWEFTLIEGLADGHVALLQQVHHTITDGVGGLKLSLELLEFEPHPNASDPLDTVFPEAAPEPVVEPLPSPVTTTTASIEWAIQQVGKALDTIAEGVVDRIRHPEQIATDVAWMREFVASAQRQVFIRDTARSPFMQRTSLARHVELASFPIDPAKKAAHALGGSLNDIFVAAVAGALGRYHVELGQPVDELRMSMAVSTHAESAPDANAFAPARVLVPVGGTRGTRFQTIHERLRATRNEMAVRTAGSLAQLFSPLPDPVIVAMMRQQAATIDFATSNLRGSPIPLYVGGQRIVASYPIGPRSGCGLNITLLSYCDQCMLGCNIDPAVIHDPERFMRCLHAELDALLAYAS